MYLVTLTRSGPEWDPTQPAERQSRWPAHAAFMDDLTAEGFVVLGGPLGDEHRAVLVIEADSAEEVRAKLEQDPWSATHLEVQAVESWTIRLDGRNSR